MTSTEILADLKADEELAGAIANLEACFFQPLEEASDLDLIKRQQLFKARDALAVAAAAVERLAEG